jgi:hypothetical protein
MSSHGGSSDAARQPAGADLRPADPCSTAAPKCRSRTTAARSTLSTAYLSGRLEAAAVRAWRHGRGGTGHHHV